MCKLKVIPDGHTHIAQAFQKGAGAEIKRRVLPDRAHGGGEHHWISV